MLRTASLTLLASAVAAIAWTQPAAPQPARAATAAEGIDFEPVVVYDVSGGTLGGTIHVHLTVYNTGFATISKRNNNPFGNLDIDVKTANVGEAAAGQLLTDLVQAGATSLSDQNLTVADIPLTTLTIAQGQEVALSRTFSYWVGTNQYSGVAGVIGDFTASTFPGF